MTNTNKHHFQKHVFLRQARPTIEEHIPTSPIAHTDTRTTGKAAAGTTRAIPLDVERVSFDTSRHVARQPADPGERRPDAAPTQTHPVQQGRGSPLRRGEGVPLQDSRSTPVIAFGTSALRPDAQAHTQTTEEPAERGVRRDPDSARSPQKLLERPLGGVRQDKAHLKSVPSASRQPSPVTKVTLSLFTNNSVVRSQKGSSARQKSGRISFWADPALKARLESKALKEGLSISATCAAFLRKALQEDIDLEYSSTLEPFIDRSITRNMRRLATRLSWLLVRVAFDAGQTRSLVTNILGRQPGVTGPLLKTILDGSARSAKANIMRRTPHIASLIEAVEQWMVEDEAQDKKKKTND